MMRTLTKVMLLDPVRRIQLDDLITQEANRAVAALEDSSFGDGPLVGTEPAGRNRREASL